jgi:hypothetical protein
VPRVSHSEQCRPDELAELEVAHAPLLFRYQERPQARRPSGNGLQNDADAIDKAKVIAVGVSLDRPNGKIEVHNSLLNVVLHDKPEIHGDKPTSEE